MHRIDRLRTATEEIVLDLQDAAPLFDLGKPRLEANAQQAPKSAGAAAAVDI
jgi:hypothetical protein